AAFPDATPGRTRGFTQAAAAMGAPLPVVTGMHFALEPGSGRNSVPVRSAMVGAVVAVVVVVATVVFGASLDSLVNHPALYGWNWDTALVSGGDIPQQQATTMLAADHSVAQWSGVYTAALFVDGTPTPVLGERPGAPVAPPVLSGHGLTGPAQIVLGPVTMARLHEHVGGTVTVASGGAQPPATLRVVGTAALPVLGSNGGPHLEMGTGAVLPWRYIPAPDRNPFDNPLTGPNAILVRLRHGADPVAARRGLERIAGATSNTANFGDVVTPVLRPAEIVNYRSLGNVPLYLGTGLAVGSVAALTLTLLASVRRRRHDLALLKTLGFTRRQFVATVAWQATVAMVVGAAVGVPAGIAAGRWLWDLFAGNIHAVPAPAVPALTVALIAVCGVIVAVLVALVPGRMAADISVAGLLGSE
ncbi:MAG: ABC transporter permease, partial [Acidobacteriota bacterium]|nr:ABC transporter permease [Acidobacteriota bacterium]